MLKYVSSVLILLISISSIFAQKNKSGQFTGWENFIHPEVSLINNAGDHSGVSTYTDLCKANGFDSIVEFVQDRAKLVAEKLYFTVDEANAHNLKKITYTLTDGGALSAKGGAPPHITISFDVNYIESFVNNHGNEKATDEVSGVLCHELTHGYQKEPKKAGSYKEGDEFYGFIEGAADYGRLLTGGFNPPRSPKQGGSWTSGYTTTGFFYLWISKYFNRPEFLKEINKTADEYDKWSMDVVAKSILGLPAKAVWDIYQEDIKNYPWDINTDLIVNFSHSSSQYVPASDTITFYNGSINGKSFHWEFEGGTPANSTEKNPKVIFDSEGIYEIKLEVEGDTETKTKIDSITVVLYPDKLQEITDHPIGKISTQYSDSPENEGIEMLIDNNYSTKFLTFHSGAWVEFYVPKSYAVFKYQLTSANDAEQRDPKEWTLKGSIDGTNWELIDEKENEEFQMRFQTNEYLVRSDIGYNYFRFDFKNNNGSIFQIAEMELFGAPKEYTTVVEDHTAAGLPSEFKLGNAYPNPFNPETRIEYSIKSNIKGEKSNVVLKVFDLLGREIVVLVNQQQPAGNYFVDFVGNDLPSGIYMYRLTTGNYSETKKMMLLK